MQFTHRLPKSIDPTAPSRRPVHARSGSRNRLVDPHPENAVCRLDLVAGTPTRNKSADERRVGEINRDRVAQHPAHSRRRHHPAVSPQFSASQAVI